MQVVAGAKSGISDGTQTAVSEDPESTQRALRTPSFSQTEVARDTLLVDSLQKIADVAESKSLA